MTPEELAAWLTDNAAQAHLKAMERYPIDREERLADEAAQLRTLIEVAAQRLQAMEGGPQ